MPEARNHHGPGCSHTSGVPTRPTRATAHPSETKTEAPPRQQKAVRSRPAVAESPPPPTTSTSTAIHLCPKSDDHGPIESSHQHIRRSASPQRQNTTPPPPLAGTTAVPQPPPSPAGDPHGPDLVARTAATWSQEHSRPSCEEGRCGSSRKVPHPGTGAGQRAESSPARAGPDRACTIATQMHPTRAATAPPRAMADAPSRPLPPEGKPPPPPASERPDLARPVALLWQRDGREDQQLKQQWQGSSTSRAAAQRQHQARQQKQQYGQPSERRDGGTRPAQHAQADAARGIGNVLGARARQGGAQVAG